MAVVQAASLACSLPLSSAGALHAANGPGCVEQPPTASSAPSVSHACKRTSPSSLASPRQGGGSRGQSPACTTCRRDHRPLGRRLIAPVSGADSVQPHPALTRLRRELLALFDQWLGFGTRVEHMGG